MADPASLYETVLTCAAGTLASHGFVRSGKSALFYHYSAGKKIACAIEMQKSMFNYPGSYSFTFNAACMGLSDFSGHNGSLTVSLIRTFLHQPNGSHHSWERLGMICRGCDYWWTISDELLTQYSLTEYYDRFLRADIEKAIAWLDAAAARKAAFYV